MKIAVIIERIRQAFIETKVVRRLTELDALMMKANQCAVLYRYMKRRWQHCDPAVVIYKIQHNNLVDEFNSKKYWWMSSMEKIK